MYHHDEGLCVFPHYIYTVIMLLKLMLLVSLCTLFVVTCFLQQSLFGDVPNYLSAGIPPSKFPERHFCSVCGYPFSHQLLVYLNQIV